MSDPVRSKADLRAAALAARDAFERRAARCGSRKWSPRVDCRFEIAPGTVVSGYAPIRSEIDPTPLMQKIAALGPRGWRCRR